MFSVVMKLNTSTHREGEDVCVVTDLQKLKAVVELRVCVCVCVCVCVSERFPRHQTTSVSLARPLSHSINGSSGGSLVTGRS